MNIAPNKACDVRGPGVFNICDVRSDKPVALTFVANATQGCEDQLDRVEQVRREFPQVAFVAVISKRKRSEVEKLVRDERLELPGRRGRAIWRCSTSTGSATARPRSSPAALAAHQPRPCAGSSTARGCGAS